MGGQDEVLEVEVLGHPADDRNRPGVPCDENPITPLHAAENGRGVDPEIANGGEVQHLCRFFVLR